MASLAKGTNIGMKAAFNPVSTRRPHKSGTSTAALRRPSRDLLYPCGLFRETGSNWPSAGAALHTYITRTVGPPHGPHRKAVQVCRLSRTVLTHRRLEGEEIEDQRGHKEFRPDVGREHVVVGHEQDERPHPSDE
eukprot:241719-Prymnesium_polylepis.2